MEALQCSGHILAVVNGTNSTPTLYDLSPTLSLIETLELDESPHYQLFCDRNTLILFPIQNDKIIKIALTILTTVPHQNPTPISIVGN